MYYTYVQVDSYGDYHIDKKKGISEFVIIQAENSDEANETAERIGLYFDGVDSGRDCKCCGDRWVPATEDRASGFPEVFGERVHIDNSKQRGYIHYMDGSVRGADYAFRF